MFRPSESNSTTCKFDIGQALTGTSFVFLEQDSTFRDTNWWRACSQVIEVPVLKSGVPPDPRNDPTWKNGGYGSSIRQGFQLAWNQSEKLLACDQCERTEGRCGYSQAGEFIACLCSGGYVSAAHNCTNGPPGKPLEALVLVSQIAAGITGCFCFKFIIPALFSSL